MLMDRRSALAGLGLAALAPGLARAQARPPLAGGGLYVPSDFAPLRRVIVCPPSEGRAMFGLGSDGFYPERDVVDAAQVAQHGALTTALKASGAEVLEVPALLESAVAAARGKGVFDTWLSVVHPRLADHAAQVTGATLLGRDPAFNFRTGADGRYLDMDVALGGEIFVRDVAVMTPRGVLILNLGSQHRRRETTLMRFIFDHAPELAGYPILWDARREGLLAEGGDFQVVDEKTLFLGVGNRTDPRVAPILAKRLNMDVLAVQTRQAESLRTDAKRFPLRGVFLHLDTYFTHLGPKKVVTLPWLLEQEFAGKDPYSEFLAGFGPDSAVEEGDLETASAFLKDFGKVRLFKAGGGEADAAVKDMKLVDYVRRRGYQVEFVGGPPPAAEPVRHMMETVFGEHGRQAANVVATAPGSVIAYEGAPVTHAALARAGVQVTAIPARDLWPWNGGPHCLTMPLERG